MAISKANQRAVNKYVKNNYDRINVTMPKGQRDVIKAHAESRSQSVNGFINEAIEEKMEREKRAGALGSNGPAGKADKKAAVEHFLGLMSHMPEDVMDLDEARTEIKCLRNFTAGRRNGARDRGGILIL